MQEALSTVDTTKDLSSEEKGQLEAYQCRGQACSPRATINTILNAAIDKTAEKCKAFLSRRTGSTLLLFKVKIFLAFTTFA